MIYDFKKAKTACRDILPMRNLHYDFKAESRNSLIITPPPSLKIGYLELNACLLLRVAIAYCVQCRGRVVGLPCKFL